MAWRVEFHKAAQKEFAKLDPQVRGRVLRFLADRLEGCSDPRIIGEALKGDVLGRYWKYRVGDWRVICNLQDEILLVLVVRIGNRREVYR
jgi:mRNA interferase RelE/StbE